MRPAACVTSASATSDAANDELGDGGFTIVEVLIAFFIISVAVIGLLGVIVGAIHEQSVQKQQAVAVRIANGALESASQDTTQSSLWNTLVSSVGTAAPVTSTVNGTLYTESVMTALCSASDTSSTCTRPSGTATPIIRATVTVSWQKGDSKHSVTMTRTLAQSYVNSLTSGTSDLLNGVTGTGGISAAVGTLVVSPNSVSLSGTHPSHDIKVTLTLLSTSSANSVPVSWADENGTHSTTLTGSGTTFSVLVPASSITAANGDEIEFTAAVPNARAVPTATLTISAGAATTSPTPSATSTSTPTPTATPTATTTQTPTKVSGTCAVTEAVTYTKVLGVQVPTYTPQLACSTTGLSAADSVVATSSLAGLSSVSLSSSDGTSWRGTGSGLSAPILNVSVKFTLTRRSDGAAVSYTVLAS